jgi:outer membrane biosynthesis protein TonB
MDYEKAEKIRKQSFGSLLGEQEGGFGASLKSAISQKTQAKMTGLKEKFDPMNLARAVGGKTGASIYGKVFGRDQASMERFAGVRKKRISEVGTVGKASGDSSPAEVLGLIYRMMLRNAEDEKLQNELKQNKKEEEDKEEKDRNEQLIRALTGRKKPPTRKEKVKEKKPEGEKPAEPTKPTVPKGKGKGKAPTKAPEVKPKAEKAPKVKPKAEKAPEVIPPKPKVTPTPAKPPVPKISTGVKVTAGAAAAMLPLGALSAKFESSKAGPAAIGYDSTGGTSYGTYQLASKVGVVKEFLGYLSNVKPEWAKSLSESGEPNTGSTKGQFPDTWRKIATENPKEFDKIQHDFIEKKHYLPTVKSLSRIGYDVDSQPAAIKDVVWSTAVQHGVGGATSIFKKAIEESGGVNASPENIIKKVYDIRRTKFGSSTENVRASVNKRFDIESKMAMEMLNNSGMQIDQASKENKDLKVKPNDSAAPIIINNTTSTQQTNKTTPRPQGGDDRSAYQKKNQG